MPQIDSILQEMVKYGASDLHLNSGCAPAIRVHGDIHILPEFPEIPSDQVIQLLGEIMPRDNMQNFERNHDTDFAYEIPGMARFRVNIFQDIKGAGAVFRAIPCRPLTADELGLPNALKELCHLRKGLILVTGPTGSGKSTTIASMIDYINENRRDHIITIENPIEFVHPNKYCIISQREIRRHTNDFKAALKAATREDPDVVFVGEMNDLETIEAAMVTAEAGHLVFGTLHTSTAQATVDRILDQFQGDKQNQIRQMLSNSLKGVLAQTLVKRLDEGGRAAAMEILVVSPAVAGIIREGKTYQIFSAIQTGGHQGMVLLNDSLIRLVNSKVVSPDEAFSKAVDKDDFKERLAKSGVFTGSLHQDISIDQRNLNVRYYAPGEKTVQSSPSPGKKAIATDDFQAFRSKMFSKRKIQRDE